jgi:DNA-binding phage protein
MMSYVYIHKGNPDKDFQILDILNEMRNKGLPNGFIYSLMENCLRYEGLRDLMQMWFEETDIAEQDKMVADLQECLNDLADLPQKPEERPYLRYDDLIEIKRDVLQFKKQLRGEVDRHGGISELARKTGIPQPSLSRFFSSASMPRRTTLYKIAKALHLPESAVGFKWTS